MSNISKKQYDFLQTWYKNYRYQAQERHNKKSWKRIKVRFSAYGI